MQTIVIQRLITHLLSNVRKGIWQAAMILSLSHFVSVVYATSLSPVSTRPFLTPNETQLINKIANNQSLFPAWVIAGLLDASERIGEMATNQPVGQVVRLTEVLAEPDRFKSKIIVLQGLFRESADVRKDLDLSPPDHCWSVYLLDAMHSKPIQCFTPKDPSRFLKNQRVKAIGIFLGTRLDRPRKGESTERIAIPVLTGVVLPDVPLISGTSPMGTGRKVPGLVIIVVALLFFYICVRIIVSKMIRKGNGPMSKKMERDWNEHRTA